MPVNSSTIAGFTKNIYSPDKIENQQNLQYVTYTRLGKAMGNIGGNGYFFSVLLSGNQEGLGSQNELENLRQSGYQRTAQGVIRPKILTDTIQFSGLSLKIANGGEEAFANNYTYQMDQAIEDATKELNGQLFRDGSGLLTRVNGAVVASPTVVLDSVQYIKMNMLLDIFDAATDTIKQAAGVQVIDINLLTKTITLNIAVSVDDNAFVYRQNVHDNAPPDGKELAGLKLAVDDGTVSATYEGIARTGVGANPNWRSNIINAGNVNLTNDLLQRTITRIKIAGAPDPDFLIAHPQQTRKYLDVVTPLKRFDKTQTLDSGYTALEWNGRQWMEDVDCPEDAIYLLNKKYYQKYINTPLTFADDDGNVLKWNPGFDGFICYLRTYMNMGSQRPNALARLENLVVPSF